MTVLNTVLNTVLSRSRKKLIIAAMQSHALMAWAFANERIEKEDGGYNITNPLLTGRNPTVGSYEYYDQLPVVQTDEFRQVEYRWSRVAGTVIISRQEEDENKGEAATTKLLAGKLEALEISFKERFSGYLYGIGVGTDPLGVGAIIPDDPSVGTLGLIDRATEVQWRPSSYDFAGTLNSTNIEEAYDDVLLDLKQGAERPSVIIAGRNQFRTYRAAARDKTVIQLGATQNGKRMVDLGFDGVMHNGVPIVYDEACPVDRSYFVNDRYFRMHILGDNNMKNVKLSAPWNVDGSGERVIWQGQFCSWRQYRTHGVVND
jgi:hypothetical protein